MSKLTRIEAKAILRSRGLVQSYRDEARSYWTRTDGNKEVFSDHSATITRVGTNDYIISDFTK